MQYSNAKTKKILNTLLQRVLINIFHNNNILKNSIRIVIIIILMIIIIVILITYGKA